MFQIVTWTKQTWIIHQCTDFDAGKSITRAIVRALNIETFFGPEIALAWWGTIPLHIGGTILLHRYVGGTIPVPRRNNSGHGVWPEPVLCQAWHWQCTGERETMPCHASHSLHLPNLKRQPGKSCTCPPACSFLKQIIGTLPKTYDNRYNSLLIFFLPNVLYFIGYGTFLYKDMAWLNGIGWGRDQTVQLGQESNPRCRQVHHRWSWWVTYNVIDGLQPRKKKNWWSDPALEGCLKWSNFHTKRFCFFVLCNSVVYLIPPLSLILTDDSLKLLKCSFNIFY